MAMDSTHQLTIDALTYQSQINPPRVAAEAFKHQGTDTRELESKGKPQISQCLLERPAKELKL